MAWQYSGFEAEPTDELRLAMLRKHIAELSAAIGATIGSDTKSLSTGTIEARLVKLEQRRADLEKRVNSSLGSMPLRRRRRRYGRGCGGYGCCC